MSAHHKVLEAAVQIARARKDWTFTLEEIVRALPDANAGTVRTHVTSRCCVNAPKNHPHKWDYFERVGRGKYRVLPAYRGHPSTHSVAREPGVAYRSSPAARHTIHAAVTRGTRWYSAECLEIAVVTQGRTFDETLTNLREAIALHLEDGGAETLGLSPPLSLLVTFEEDVA